VVEGALADHVVAFARRLGAQMTITVVPRLSLKLLRQGGIVFGEAVWGDTRLVLKRTPRIVRNILDGRPIETESGNVHIGSLLKELPVGLLAIEK
jgi:maltooligosyltrehalose synthase